MLSYFYSKDEKGAGIPKGGINKYWVAEDKYKIIQPVWDLEESIHAIIRETEGGEYWIILFIKYVSG